MPSSNPSRTDLIAVRRPVPFLAGAGEPLPQPASGPVHPLGRPTRAASPSQEYPMTDVFTSISLDRLEAMLDAGGIVARREHAEEAEFLKFNLGSFKVLLLPYGEGPDYPSIQLHAGFSAAADPDAVNAWNRDNRFGRAFLDTEGDPILQYDLDLEGGATERTFQEFVRTFRALLEDFSETVVEG